MISKYSEELQAIGGVILVGLNLLGLLPLEALVPLLGLLSANATATIKGKLKKAGKIADELSTRK